MSCPDVSPRFPSFNWVESGLKRMRYEHYWPPALKLYGSTRNRPLCSFSTPIKAYPVLHWRPRSSPASSPLSPSPESSRRAIAIDSSKELAAHYKRSCHGPIRSPAEFQGVAPPPQKRNSFNFVPRRWRSTPPEVATVKLAVAAVFGHPGVRAKPLVRIPSSSSPCFLFLCDF